MLGKRSNFERRERDFYPTPMGAVRPLIKHIRPMIYVEPCAGDGALVRHLRNYGFKCVSASDIEPRDSSVTQSDVLDGITLNGAESVITNPPWQRDILHRIIEICTQEKQVESWLLFDSDWMHTKQARPYLPYCDEIVAVGRVKWIEDSKHTGKDNCCWYRFIPHETITKFYNY